MTTSRASHRLYGVLTCSIPQVDKFVCKKRLDLDSPDYMHLPVVISADGKKLSKRVQTDPVKHQDPAIAVEQALQFLGQNPPSGLSLSELWEWALEHWNSDLIPRARTIYPATSDRIVDEAQTEWTCEIFRLN